MSLPQNIRTLARRTVFSALGAFDSAAGAYSRLGLISDSTSWVISHEMREVTTISRRLGVSILPPKYCSYAQRQCLFFGSHFDLFLNDQWFERKNRYGTAFFHGRPGEGNPEFDRCFEMLKKHREQVHAIQVSHSAMREVVLSTGVDPARVVQIPIGVDAARFPRRSSESRRAVRERLGIPDSAVVVGSFQKDGVGWDEGLKPKWVKGPDVFADTMIRLKERIPELFVLLSGPSRGYIKSRLSDAGIPYQHHMLDDYFDVSGLFQALDLYVIASREEGGPKAVLESMASGVPLVSTRVGQAMDLVQHEVNGWMVDVEDVDGLAHWAEHALQHTDHTELLNAARTTAEVNSYAQQDGLWRQLMQGFVEGVS